MSGSYSGWKTIAHADGLPRQFQRLRHQLGDPKAGNERRSASACRASRVPSARRMTIACCGTRHRTVMDAPDDKKMAHIQAGVQRLMLTLTLLVNWMSGVSARPGQATAMLLARARYAGERYVN